MPAIAPVEPTPSAPTRDRDARVPHHHVAIVGSGFGGIGMAVRLRMAGFDDFVVLEKAGDVGGTWRDNTYPGIQCDVPSNLYSFSFAPNHRWSRTFGWGGEILDYLRGVTDRFGIRPKIRFDSEVTAAAWDGGAGRWRITTSSGELTANVLVAAQGFLSAPSVPEFPGLDSFEGTIFHSAAWNHDHDLAGERVGVVGTGASAIQIVPAIAPEVGTLTLFQRTPAWIVPRPDRAFGPRTAWLYEHLPALQRVARCGIYWTRELSVVAMAKRPKLMRALERVARRHLRTQVADPDLRRKLTPNYQIGCKRILLSNDYYPALCQDNVSVVTEGIDEITPHGVRTADGVEHELDTLVLATGFLTTDHPITHLLRGADGRTLAEHWSNGMRGYLGTTVSGFPNLFTIVGPNTGLGHSSMVFMMESQFNYIVDAVRTMREQGLASVDVREDVMDAYANDMARELDGTIWASGCASWYLDAAGRNTTLWPTFTWTYRRRTRHFDPTSYHLARRDRATDSDTGAAPVHA